MIKKLYLLVFIFGLKNLNNSNYTLQRKIKKAKIDFCKNLESKMFY